MKIRKEGLIAVIVLIFCFACKKSSNITDCNCATLPIAENVSGVLSFLNYYPQKDIWTFSYQYPAGSGYTYHFIPCNINQDSLVAITKTADKAAVFNVRFSGKTKKLCNDDYYNQFQSGTATYRYLEIDSLRRQ